MAQPNALRADESEEQTASSRRRPTLLYDNGHGTKVVRWDEGVSNLQIERSYMPKGATDPSQRVTEKINVTPEEALGIIFGLQKGVEQTMEKAANKQQSQGRG
jgi:hypothetical protein